MKHSSCRPFFRPRSGISRMDVFVVLCVTGFLIWMAASRVGNHPPARRMACQNNLKQIALATLQYAAANDGRMPLFEDGQFGWPVALLPHLDNATLYRALKEDPLVVEKAWRTSKTPLLIKVLACPEDSLNAGHHLGLSYVANAGWGRFLADAKTEAITESRLHSADVDWNSDGNVTDEERSLTRATGMFWRAHADGYQMTIDEITEADGQSQTILFAENTNARNWLSRETFDLGFVVGLDRIEFASNTDPTQRLKVKSANLGPFAIRPKPRVLPGRSPVPSSHHTGIVNVAFADGRVEQMNVNIDTRVYLQLMTPDGKRFGEPQNRFEP